MNLPTLVDHSALPELGVYPGHPTKNGKPIPHHFHDSVGQPAAAHVTICCWCGEARTAHGLEAGTVRPGTRRLQETH